MGIFYIIYKRNVNRGLIKGIYKGSIYIIQSTNKNHIGSGPKVHSSILKGLYSKTKNLNNDFNNILPINR